MFAKFLAPLFALIVAVPFVLAPASAQDTKFSKEKLDQLLAPIALYPDDVVSNVLMAATYPLEVVEAARWVKVPDNAKLKGDELTVVVDKKDWAPSVKSLVPFPEVLFMMSDQLEWMQNLGDAFLAQEAEVMAEIQVLREKADDAGNLESNKQQTVKKESSGGKEYIYIEPASPDVVYVPVYDPVVYGPWWYPDYPPYYWPPPRGRYFVGGYYWGAGFIIVRPYWGWGRPYWRGGYINVNVNRYNKINVNRQPINSNRWQHNAYHRRGVRYNNNQVRNKYAKGDTRRGKDGRNDYRGRDGKPGSKPGGGNNAGKGRPGDRKDAGKAKPGDRKSAGKGKPGDRPSATKPKTRPSGGAKKRPSSGSKNRKSNNAFSKPRNRSSTKKHSSRGRSSMGRGGGGRGGGRGGRRGGGRGRR